MFHIFLTKRKFCIIIIFGNKKILYDILLIIKNDGAYEIKFG